MKEAYHNFANALVFKALNQTQAYLEAFPQSSDESARKNVTALMARNDVKELIEAKRLEKAEIVKAPLKEESRQGKLRG